MIELVCATSNEHKLLEFRRASEPQVLVTGSDPRDCPETGDSFEANAVQKALCYNLGANAEWLFADDSGLEVEALDGAPGIHSARFAGPGSTDQVNNRLLLRKLAAVPPAQRGARFVCVIALLYKGSVAQTFRGEVEGSILRRHSGGRGFGYDPLFHYPPMRKSFGCLSAGEKWKYSHRGKAYRAMLGWILDRR